ncbi:MAG: hypothetical protein ABGX12_06470 [Desulfurobacteriaceae bacterium]
MKWIETYKGYLINPKAIESIGVGKKEEFDRHGRSYVVYAVMIKAISGNVYYHSVHKSKEEAESEKAELYNQLLLHAENVSV